MICYAEQNNLKPARGTSGESSICVATLAGLIGDDRMKRITLTQGRFALVDNEDYDWLMQWKWCAYKHGNTHYAKSKVGKMHRLILGFAFGDDKITDHVNRNGLDNQRHNIRACNCSQNRQNAKGKEGCSSKYKGVSRVKRINKWQVSIGKIYVGTYGSEIEAAKVYDKKATELFGEFAYLNFSKEADNDK